MIGSIISHRQRACQQKPPCGSLSVFRRRCFPRSSPSHWLPRASFRGSGILPPGVRDSLTLCSPSTGSRSSALRSPQSAVVLPPSASSSALVHALMRRSRASQTAPGNRCIIAHFVRPPPCPRTENKKAEPDSPADGVLQIP